MRQELLALLTNDGAGVRPMVREALGATGRCWSETVAVSSKWGVYAKGSAGKMLRMKKLGWIVLAWFFLLEPVQAASFDCKKAQSKTEKLICSHGDLGELDEQLADVYARVKEVAPDKRALTQQQRDWMAGVRNACPDADCLSRVHRLRILELAGALVSLAPINDTLLSDEEGKSICSELATLNDGRKLKKLVVPGTHSIHIRGSSLESKYAVSDMETQTLRKNSSSYSEALEVFRLRLKQRDDPVRFATAPTGGSCPSSTMFNLSLLLSTPDDSGGIEEVEDLNDSLDMVHSGAHDYPILYRNRNFVITSARRDLSQPSLVSWIRPNGMIRPLCLLGQQGHSKIVILKASNKKLCEVLVSRPSGPVDISDRIPDSSDRDEFVQRYVRYADSMKAYRLDINSDGKAENVGHFSYASGAGCGSNERWLSVLSPDLKMVIWSPLHQAMEELVDVAAIYTVNGQHYIEGATQRDSLGLFQMRGTMLEQVCRYRLDYRTEVRDFFSVTE